jgi:hypothetical protein
MSDESVHVVGLMQNQIVQQKLSLMVLVYCLSLLGYPLPKKGVLKEIAYALDTIKVGYFLER